MPTSLAQPLWLLALVLPVLLVAWEVLWRRRALVVPFDHGDQGDGVWLGRMLRGAAMTPAVLLGVAVILLAGPLRNDRPGEEREMTNIEIVMDVSGSMTWQFGEGSRYDGAIAAITAFTEHREGDAFGLTIFGNEVLHWTPLTTDAAAIRSAAPFLRPEELPHQFGGTEIGKALRATLTRIRQRGDSDGLIVLLSDGESADLPGDTPRRIGAELAAANIVLYSIHIGDEEVPRDLFDLVQPNGGRVFAARDPAALGAVFAHIDRLQPVRLTPAAPRRIDAFAWPAWIGLAALGLFQVSLFGLRYTPW